MLKISDLQSQVALNSNTINYEEWQVNLIKEEIALLKLQKSNNLCTGFSLELNYELLSYHKKKIKQYAKLQRALKDEIAYRIRIDRVMREVEAWEAKAKVEGFEIVVEE